jgi:hypothetical protein
METSA